MKPFDVYPLFDIAPVKAEGSYIWDKSGARYLDMYGGHAVISIGHSHPYYVSMLSQQLKEIAFYSNSVHIPQQALLAQKLGRLSGYTDYNLFLCNSGAEANENAFKLASFHTGRKKIIAFTGSFHGRTSLAVEATDDSSIVAPVNQSGHVLFLPLNDEASLTQISSEVAGVIVEGIQGVGGIQEPSQEFLQALQSKCRQHGALLIVDEIQSGYGRSGKFFAHQYAGIRPDLVTVAKGMGNGFPIAGVLIAPHIKGRHGMLGTTFGGNHLACSAGLAVLDVIESEKLLANALTMGTYFKKALSEMPNVRHVRGKGLMLGIDLHGDAAATRRRLLEEHKIFTGYSPATGTIRLLPALTISQKEIDHFLNAFKSVLQTQTIGAA
jgi:acetylornithine/N-succinyldiaminopimelate aminotransferase